MRILLLAAMAAVCVGSMGGGCVPSIQLNENANSVTPGKTLAAVILLPDASRTVSQGSLVRIRWTAANKTGEDALADIVVRSRNDDTETILLGGVRITVTGTTQDLLWDTTDFQGPFDIGVRITAGDEKNDFKATTVTTVDAAPTFAFTAPTVASTIEVGGATAPSLSISYTGGDPDGNGKTTIRIDPDSDHTSGNEITIFAARDLPKIAGSTTINWNGQNSSNTNVAAGTYFLFAEVKDGVNADQTIEGLAQIAVTTAAAAPTLAVTAPATDTEFITGTTASSRIEYSFPNGRTANLLVDLKLDPDDNNQNGNEITVLSQRLILPATSTDFFDWTGIDVNGANVPPGIYRVLLSQSTGTGNPTVVAAAGKFLVRSASGLPIVSALEPATDQTLTAGSFLTIRWRDDDPSGSATIRVILDDDNMPSESVETGAAEIEILANRSASQDDILDAFQFQIPNTLAAGTYFITVFIDRDGAAPFDGHSTCAGRLKFNSP